MGHVFQLGKKYAEALDLRVLDQNGKLTTVVMGSYGVGVSCRGLRGRGNNDDAGIIWPRELGRPTSHRCRGQGRAALRRRRRGPGAGSGANGLTCIVDDRRGVSPGVKFKDSELIGVPTIVVVGRGLAEEVEIKDRRSGERREVALDSAVESRCSPRCEGRDRDQLGVRPCPQGARQAVIFDWGGTSRRGTRSTFVLVDRLRRRAGLVACSRDDLVSALAR